MSREWHDLTYFNKLMLATVLRIDWREQGYKHGYQFLKYSNIIQEKYDCGLDQYADLRSSQVVNIF